MEFIYVCIQQERELYMALSCAFGYGGYDRFSNDLVRLRDKFVKKLRSESFDYEADEDEYIVTCTNAGVNILILRWLSGKDEKRSPRQIAGLMTRYNNLDWHAKSLWS